jgi:hypothetical protein
MGGNAMTWDNRRLANKLLDTPYDPAEAAAALGDDGEPETKRNGRTRRRIDAPDSREESRAPVLLRLADVRPEPVRWLWPQRIARGKLTLLAGDPGLGKSFLTLDLAARVSRGDGWPDGTALKGPGGVVLMSAEDDPADTIRPRLDSAGADVQRIVLLSAVRYTDAESGKSSDRQVCLQTDLAALEQAIRETPDCRLVVIDPITAYLGGTDSHKNAEIRGLLAPLAELAQRYGVAILAVTHLNKAAGMSALYRAMGSLAFVAAARAVWLVIRDADDPSGKRRLLLPAKNNIGNDRSGLAFALQSAPMGSMAVVTWEPTPVDVSADDALAPRDGRRKRASPVLDEAMEWLRGQLTGGPRPAKELKAAADADGIKWPAVRRAKGELRVVATRDGFGAAGAWVWTLPEAPEADGESACAPMD